MKKRNHFGFTLIEMIVSFAVLGIAVLGIGAFFVSSSRSYAGTSSETGLQYEAQMALNQIEGTLIDSTLGVNYNVVDGSGNHFLLKDDSSIASPTEKVLYVFNTDGTNFTALLIKWDAAAKELRYKEITSLSEYSNVGAIPIGGSDWDLLAEGVESFSIDLSRYKTNKTVEIGLTMTKRDKEYTTTGVVTLRNNVLVNEESLSEIYNNASGINASIINSVTLSANTNVTVPGGEVQLATKVSGVYPSQDIYKWYVASTYDEINGSTLAGDGTLITDNKTYIDEGTKKLHISPDSSTLQNTTFHSILYVQCAARTFERDVDGVLVEKLIYSNVVTINVQDITAFGIYPSANLDLAANAPLKTDDLKKGVRTWETLYQGSSQKNEVVVYPSSVIQMNKAIQGTAGIEDTEVNWSILSKSEGVIASITEDGLVTIDSNSQPGYLNINGTIKSATDYSVTYRLNVSSLYSASNVLAVSAPSEINRGAAPVQCTLTLDGTTVHPSDYNWFVTVKSTSGQTVSGSPVEISDTGVLTVKDSLSFDYKYLITVSATMKSNNDVSGSAIVQVPKVSMLLTPTEMRAYIGRPVQKDAIICTVKGLETYSIDWTIAKATNPTYYFTAYGNTNITGYETEKGHTPYIAIGADEPSSLEWIRVKATLSGYSNYFATTKLNLQEGSGSGSEEGGGSGEGTGGSSGGTTTTNAYRIVGGGTLNRGDSMAFRVVDASDKNVEAEWIIIKAESGSSSRDTSNNIRIEKKPGSSGAELKVDATYELANERYKEEILVYVGAYVNGVLLDSQGVAKIAKVTMKLNGTGQVNKWTSYGYEIEWQNINMSNSDLYFQWGVYKNNFSSTDKLYFYQYSGYYDEKATLYVGDVNDFDGKNYVVVAYLIDSSNNNYITLTKDISVKIDDWNKPEPW